MNTIQQVAMAAVCLVAAFAFGSFINQSKNDQAAQIEPATQGVQSLIERDFLVEKVPGSTPRMRSKLPPRLPMPPLPNKAVAIQSDFGFAQTTTTGDIPSPSNLDGRTSRTKPTQDSLAGSFSLPAETTQPMADAPSFAPSAKGNSSMPVFNKQDLGSLNLAESMRSPFQTDEFDKPKPMVENAPVFAVQELPSKTLPRDQTNHRQLEQPSASPVFEQAPAFPNLNQRSQPVVAAKPTLPERRTAPLRSIADINDTAPRRTEIRSPGSSSFETATSDQFRYSNTRRDSNDRDQNNLMPVPSLRQTVTIGDPGGAFGNRDNSGRDNYNRESPERNTQSTWSNGQQSVLDTNASYYPEEAQRLQSQPQIEPQRRVTRLPLQLNSNAQTKLTRLRNNTIQKISLSTTQFDDYTVETGDSLQSISNRYFGKPDYYLDIYLANRDRLRYPGDLREGMSIKIPVYQQ